MRSPEHRIATGVLVIGSGGGGLRVAIELVEVQRALLNRATARRISRAGA